MLTLIIILAVVAFLLVASTTVFVTTRIRGRDTDLAPPLPPIPPVFPGEGSATTARAPPGSLHDATALETSLPEARAPETLEPATLVPETLGPETLGPDRLPEDFGDASPGVGAPVGLAEAPRLRDRMGRVRSLFAGYVGSARSRDRIDETTWEELEEALILADMGLEVTASILDDLRGRVRSEKITSPAVLLEALKADLVGLLEGDRELHLAETGTTVWLFVGVNGVGKTTTIGKLGMRQQAAGHSVVMAAGDTFRAAAADQLALWADRVGAEVIRGKEGGDPGAVIFDAVQHAAAKGSDLVLADTAGRLHTKVNLMEELKKVRRVAERPPGQVREVLLVIDATTGQNGLVQAKQFTTAVDVTGVVLTKLDGTAKGGIAVAITAELGIPIKMVGLGEKAEDLITFDAVEFVEAVFSGS